MAPWPSVAIETAVIEHPIVLFSSARQICRSGPLPGMRCIRDRWAVWGLPAPTHITRRNELPRRTSALFGCCDRGEGLATDYATSSIVAISWVGPPLTFKIYPDARRRSARKPLAFSSACNAFRSGASRSAINASRSGRLRSAGWLAAHAFASMLRRRGSHPLARTFREVRTLADTATQEAAISLSVAAIDAKGWQSLPHGKIGLGRKFCAPER
jgi:hypothetical protein